MPPAHRSVPAIGGKWNKKDISNKCKAINAQRKRQQSSRSPSIMLRPPGMPAFMPPLPDPREKVRKRKRPAVGGYRKRPAVGGDSRSACSTSGETSHGSEHTPTSVAPTEAPAAKKQRSEPSEPTSPAGDKDCSCDWGGRESSSVSSRSVHDEQRLAKTKGQPLAATQKLLKSARPRTPTPPSTSPPSPPRRPHAVQTMSPRLCPALADQICRHPASWRLVKENVT